MRLAPERNARGDAALRLPELLIEGDTDESRWEARQVLDAIPPGFLDLRKSAVFASRSRGRGSRQARDRRRSGGTPRTR